MTWGKIDDGLALHPKVMQAGNEAMGLWVRALSYSCQQLTDGFIPDEIVSVLSGKKIAKKLVDSGLWTEKNGGFQFKDWCDYQPTREQVMNERNAAKSRMSRIRSGNVRANITRTSGEVQEKFGDPDPTRPDLLTTSKDVVSAKRATRIPDIFPITPEMHEWAKKNVPGMDYKTATAMFHDYWLSASGSTSRKHDWVRAWQVWMRKDYQRMTPGQRASAVTENLSDTNFRDLFCKKHDGWPANNCDRCTEEAHQ